MKQKHLIGYGIMLFALLSINVVGGHAQSLEEQDTLGPVYQVVDEMPEFPGGNAALMEYLRNNIIYPEVARQFEIEGRVLVRFIVEPDGSIDSVQTVKSLQLMVDREARRVVAEMPKWKPGNNDGKAVRVEYTLPINFRLADAKEKPQDKNVRKDIENVSFSSLVSMVNKGNKEMSSPIVVDDPSDLKNKCLSLSPVKSPVKSSDTQLMLYCNQPFTYGDTIFFSIKAKAITKQKVSTELHSTPGTRIVSDPFNFSEIGTEWTELSSKYIVNYTRPQTIVLNLAYRGKGNVCYFDDIKIEVHRFKQVTVIVNKKPEFPGGVEALKKYLSDNNRYPAQKPASTVYEDISFMVETDGSLSNISVVGGLNDQLDEEAIRLVAGMPKWIPASISGNKWRHYVTIPIAFDNMNMVVTRKNDNDSDQAVIVAEDMPEFPGGKDALLDFLRSNVKYPAIAQENGIQGRVIVSFIVEVDGSISGAEVVGSVSPVLDREALRVISIMPNWKPGKKGGKPVRVKYTVPVNFKLN